MKVVITLFFLIKSKRFANEIGGQWVRFGTAKAPFWHTKRIPQGKQFGHRICIFLSRGRVSPSFVFPSHLLPCEHPPTLFSIASFFSGEILKHRYAQQPTQSSQVFFGLPLFLHSSFFLPSSWATFSFSGFSRRKEENRGNDGKMNPTQAALRVNELQFGKCFQGKKKCELHVYLFA